MAHDSWLMTLTWPWRGPGPGIQGPQRPQGPSALEAWDPNVMRHEPCAMQKVQSRKAEKHENGS